MSTQPNIHDLWQKICDHPDFAGGTVFTRQDVADAIYEPQDGWKDGEAPQELVDRLTSEQISAAVEAIRSYIFDEELFDTWRDAFRRRVPTS
jgi:hypothetical protein